MRVINTRMHGMMDYLIGVVLLIAPNLLGFVDVPIATFAARAVGAIVLLQAVMTKFEVGLVRVIPMRMHLMMDYVIGAFLALSPWLLGFASGNRANVWAPHLIVGLLIFLQALLTYPDTRVGSLAPVQEMRPGGGPRRAA